MTTRKNKTVPRLSRLPVVLLLSLASVGTLACKPRGQTTAPNASGWEARALQLERAVAEDPDDATAWRDLAHVRWIHLGQPDVARGLLEANAEQRGDLASRLSLVVMGDARLDVGAVEKHGHALVKAAAAMRPGDPQRGFADAAAEYTARRLAAVHGDLPGMDKRFVAMFDPVLADIDAGKATLSYAALQPLISLRAAIARRRGNEYRPYYAREGCVQDWTVGPLTGHLGPLELPAVDVGQPLVADEDAELAELACVVRVWNPTPGPGVRRMQAQVDVPGDAFMLQAGAEQPSRFYVDGHLVHRTDGVDRFAPDRVTLRVAVQPGKHQLDVVTTVPSERAWVMVRATDLDAQPLKTKAGGTPGAGSAPKAVRRTAGWLEPLAPLSDPLYAPLRAVLEIDDALAEGDSDRAERQLFTLGKAKRFADGFRTRARFERADPSRGRTVSAAREQKALQTALKLDPSLDSARLRLLRLALERGEDQDVADDLEALPPDRLRSVDGEMLRYQVLRRLDREHPAEQALDRAETINPSSCRVLLARRSIARERDDVQSEDRLVDKLAACAGSLEIRARLARRRGDYDKARALWLESLDRTPDDVEALEELAALAAQLGEYDKAKGYLERILQLNPFRVSSQLALADLAASQGQPERARESLRAALAQIPHSNVLRRAASTLGIPDDLDSFRIDGSEALASYRASGVSYEGVAEVLVLDRSIVRVYDNGGQRQIVHIMAHLQTKEALDRYGEMSIPEGAQLLALHTIKPDGTRREPELITGKEGLSLRNLEVGDVVEYEFVVDQGPAGPMPGYVDVSTFRFQSLDVPYHRSELQVIHPASMAIESDRRNDPPEEIVEKHGDLVSRLWRAHEVPRRGVEPGHRSLLEELPNVHVYTQPNTDDYLGSLAVQIRGSQRSNPALRRLVRQLTKDATDDRDKLMTLWTWVVENVEDRGDLTVPATLTHAARGGNRLMLLRAMLDLAGVDVQLWLARDAYGVAPLSGGHPLLEGYDTAVLAVKLPGRKDRQMVLTASKVMPPGYLPPGLRGTRALRLQLSEDEPASGPVTVPAMTDVVDRRAWDLHLALSSDGGGTVSGTIELQGMEAVFWRQALADVDRDRIEEVFQQAELSWLRGATLSELQIEGEKDLDAPLRLRFSAEARGVGIAQDGALVLRATPMPLNTAGRYAALPKRTTGLVVPYAPLQVAELTYTIDGMSKVVAPDDAKIASKYGEFTRTSAVGGAGKLTLTVRSSLQPGVVDPAGYPGLADFAQAVDAAEQAVIVAK